MKWNFKYFLQKIVLIAVFLFGVSTAQTPFNGLVLEQLDNGGVVAVSYTHLTLPTILLV